MLGERRRCNGARETHFGSSEFIVQSIFEICLSAIHNTRVAVVQLGSKQRYFRTGTQVLEKALSVLASAYTSYGHDDSSRHFLGCLDSWLAKRLL